MHPFLEGVLIGFSFVTSVLVMIDTARLRREVRQMKRRR